MTCAIKPPMWFIEDKMYLGVEYSDLTNTPEHPEKTVWQFISISLADGKIEVLKETEEIDTDASHVDILSYKDGQLLYYKGEEVCLYRTDTKQTETILTDVTKSRWCLGTDEKQENIYYSEENEEYSEVYQLNLQTKRKDKHRQKRKERKRISVELLGRKILLCTV